MPRLRFLLRTHIHCLDCKAVFPIQYAYAAELKRHWGHRCVYTEVRP